MEPEAGLEPATSSLSTITQSCDPSKMLKDGQEVASMFLDGNRTRIFSFSRGALSQFELPSSITKAQRPIPKRNDGQEARWDPSVARWCAV